MGTGVNVAIEDTGCGIDPSIRDRIFEPFFTTKPPGEGTGLGLSICRSVVTSLGGELLVESHSGGGSTFRLQLPAASESPSATAANEARPPLRSGGQKEQDPLPPRRRDA
jgi:signal transduction histidine kinase